MASAALSRARARLATVVVAATARPAAAFAVPRRPSSLSPSSPLLARRTIMSDAPAASSAPSTVARSADVDAPATADAAAPAPVSPTAAVEAPEITKLDIRVGKILSIEVHPDADGLYVETVDLGEPEPRTIVSGLVKFVPIEQMKDRLVVALCNLKPRNMRGIKSDGMLLCASDAAHENVEPLDPPAGAVPGDRIGFELEGARPGEQPEPAGANQIQKKKVWESVQPELKVLDSKVASWKGSEMVTSSGKVTAASLAGGGIS